jgi:hypothetical protein
MSQYADKEQLVSLSLKHIFELKTDLKNGGLQPHDSS